MGDGRCVGGRASVAAMSEPGTVEEGAVDLDAIAAELDGVERALERLDDGSYWADEVTGEPIPDDLLAANPIARRAS